MGGAAGGLGAGAAGVAAMAGNVLAAGAAGFGAGSLVASMGDKFGKNDGVWGSDPDTGKANSSWDWSAAQGGKVDKWIDGMTGGEGKQGNSTLGTIAGAGTSALLGIGTAGMGLGTAIGNGIGSLFAPSGS
jgi:hypothetical protein